MAESRSLIELIILGKDQASAQLKNVEQSIQGLQKSTAIAAAAGAAMGSVMLSAIDAVVSAAPRAAQALANMAEQAERIGNDAKRTGLGTKELQVLDELFARAGMDSSELIQGMTMFNRQVALGNPLLKTYGIEGQTAMERLTRLADVLHRMPDEASRTLVMYELLGRAGPRLAAGFDEVATKYDAMAETMRRNGQLFDDSKLKNLQRLDDEIDTLKGTLDGWTKTVLGATAAWINFNIALAKRVIKGRQGGPGVGLMIGPGSPGIEETEVLGERIKHKETPAERVEKLAKAVLDLADSGKYLKQVFMEGGILHIMEMDQGAGGTDMADILDRWRATFTELGTLAEGLAYGIDAAFQNVASAIFVRSTTIGQAIRMFFVSIAQSVVAALARIMASKFIIWLGSALFGGSFFGAFLADLGSQMLGGNSAARSRTDGLGAGNTFVFPSFNPRETFLAVRSSFGEIRRANDMVRLGSVN